MSHKCGAACRRRQVPSRRSGCPTCGSRNNLDGGGKVRQVSRYLSQGRHPDVSRRMMAQALDSWVARGIHTDPDGRQSLNYFGPARGTNTLIRVAVSLDDELIINAFKDSNATKAWNRGNYDYFHRRLLNSEVRHDTESGL